MLTIIQTKWGHFVPSAFLILAENYLKYAGMNKGEIKEWIWGYLE